MPDAVKSAETSEPHELAVRPRQKDKPTLVKMAELLLQAALAWLCQFLLHTFIDLQDAILAISIIRRLMAYALLPRCRSTLASHLCKADEL